MKSLFLLCVSLLLAGCQAIPGSGRPPELDKSELISAPSAKITTLQFVYYNAKLFEVGTAPTRPFGPPVLANTGFYEFGPLLAQDATASFAAAGLTVVSQTTLQDGDPLPSRQAHPLVVVMPMQALQNAAGSRHVFQVRLFLPGATRVSWIAHIHTRTWVGADPVFRRLEHTMFDESYARAFNVVILQALKKDGLI
jgi:hypothetical protein